MAFVCLFVCHVSSSYNFSYFHSDDDRNVDDDDIKKKVKKRSSKVENPFALLDYEDEDKNYHKSSFRIIDGVGCAGNDPAIEYELVGSL